MILPSPGTTLFYLARRAPPYPSLPILERRYLGSAFLQLVSMPCPGFIAPWPDLILPWSSCTGLTLLVIWHCPSRPYSTRPYLILHYPDPSLLHLFPPCPVSSCPILERRFLASGLPYLAPALLHLARPYSTLLNMHGPYSPYPELTPPCPTLNLLWAGLILLYQPYTQLPGLTLNHTTSNVQSGSSEIPCKTQFAKFVKFLSNQVKLELKKLIIFFF